MEKEAQTILQFIEFSNKLKSQLRTIKLSKDRHESVADHSWQLALMILLVYPHLKTKPNLLRSLKMALIHDITEAEIGDTPHGTALRYPAAKAEKDRLEKLEIEKVKKMVGGDLGQEIFDIWNEYESRDTFESKLVKALDTLEANLQSTFFDVSYWDNYYYKVALEKSGKHCIHEEILVKLDNAINERLETKYLEAGFDLEKIKSGFYDNEEIGTNKL
ncbi:MAG TPA: HD domain-containing protein [bacterium]|nr:HD domain-containing protein [bacterium]